MKNNKLCIYLLCLISLLLFYSPLTLGEDLSIISDTLSADAKEFTTPPEINREDLPKSLSLITNFEFVLSLMVLFFGGFTLVVEYRLLSKSEKVNPDDAFKIIVITLIVVGSLFLITAGYTNNQIAPAMGLFGTIAGYLIGKTSVKQNPKE